MQKKTLGVVLALCLLLGVLMVMPAAAADVIELSTAEQILKLMNEDEGYPLDGNYKVVNDIDLSKYTGSLKQSPIGTAPLSSTAPGGCFYGTFDGGNYTISGLKINTSTAYTGFFGCAGWGAVIKNVNLKGTVTTSANASGGLVGYGRDTLTIANCTVDVTINGAARTAGILGGYDTYLKNTTLSIIGCTNKGAITGTGEQPAGIVGRVLNSSAASGFTFRVIGCVNEGAIGTKMYAGGIISHYGGSAAATVEIKNCINKGVITGNSYTSGIAGYVKAAAANVHVTIQNCINNADINSPGFAGGISGRVETSNADASITVDSCQNYAAVTNTNTDTVSYTFTGGIVGMISAANGPITVSQCYNEGKITGASANEVAVGGIVGYARSTGTEKKVEISDCWNAGTITGVSDMTAAKYGYVGGVVGGFPSAESAKAALTSVLTNCVNTGTVDTIAGLTIGGVIGGSNKADQAGLATTYTRSGDTWTNGTGDVVTSIGGLSGSVWNNATTNPALVHKHVFVLSADDVTVHECACGEASAAHTWVSLGENSPLHMCADCGYSETHTWLLNANTHDCEICGESVDHSWVEVGADEHKCSVCEKTGAHSYKDYACEGCGKDQPAIELTVTNLCVVPGIEYCAFSDRLNGADVQVDFDKITVAKDGENWVASGLELTGKDAEHYKLASTTFVMTDVPADYLITINVVNGTASQTEVYRGQSYSVTVTANAPAKGYRFVGWLLNDGTDPVSTASKYTMQRVATDDITLTAVYEPNPDDEQSGSSENVALILALACKNNKKCVVTIKSTGADNHETITVKKGTVLTLPAVPTKDGYTFMGWYKDINGTKPFDFNTKISGNVSIYAKWIKN